MKDLLSEANRHVKVMFFTLGETLRAATQLVDEEFKNSLSAICKIYNGKYPLFRKKNKDVSEDEFFSKIEEMFLSQHQDEHFSFSWLQGYQEALSLLAPLYDDQAYQDFLASIFELETTPSSFGEKLFFLSGGFRFYREMSKAEILELDGNLVYMLRIDRELSFIREEIAVAMATSQRRISEAERLTKTHIVGEIGRIGRDHVFQQAFVSVFSQKKNQNSSFNKFAGLVGPIVGLDQKTVKIFLESKGINKSNYHDWRQEFLNNIDISTI